MGSGTTPAPHSSADGPTRQREGADQPVRAIAIALCALSGFSLTAAVLADAASMVRQQGGGDDASRALWLHLFAVAVFTIALAALAVRPALSQHRWFTALCVLGAAGNLAVVVLQRRHQALGLVLPAIHIAVALGLVVLAVMVRRRAS